MRVHNLSRPPLKWDTHISSPYGGSMSEERYAEFLEYVRSGKSHNAGIEGVIKKFKLSKNDLTRLYSDLRTNDTKITVPNIIAITDQIKDISVVHEAVVENSISVVDEKLEYIKNKYYKETRKINEQAKFKEGFIYLIYNLNRPEYVKGGMTIDFNARLATYNVYDPCDEFRFADIKYVEDRRLSEAMLLKKLKLHSSYSKGEWFKIDKDKAVALFRE